LPGKNPRDTREAFLAPLRRSLSCITTAQIFVAGKNVGEVEALTLSEDPLRLNSARIGPVQFVLGHQFRVVQDTEGWHVSTSAYQYYLLDNNDRELIGWHWHPGTVAHPHMHVEVGAIDHRVHVPTGRVSIESVLRMLLTDLEVTPTRAHANDFLAVIDESERKFIEHRRWHG
jgi:hypothetical protein